MPFIVILDMLFMLGGSIVLIFLFMKGIVYVYKIKYLGSSSMMWNPHIFLRVLMSGFLCCIIIAMLTVITVPNAIDMYDYSQGKYIEATGYVEEKYSGGIQRGDSVTVKTDAGDHIKISSPLLGNMNVKKGDRVKIKYLAHTHTGIVKRV